MSRTGVASRIVNLHGESPPTRRGPSLERGIVRASSVLAGIVLLAGGCAPLSPEEKLRWALMEEVYWAAARECAGRYGTVSLGRVGRDGDLQVDLAAESRSELRQFTACYWEGIRQRVDARGQKGLAVPEPFNLQPGVEAD
jgi:hypothetical protein